MKSRWSLQMSRTSWIPTWHQKSWESVWGNGLWFSLAKEVGFQTLVSSKTPFFFFFSKWNGVEFYLRWEIGGEGCWSQTPGLIISQSNHLHKQGCTLFTGFWQVLQLSYFDQLEPVQTVCAALGNRLSLVCASWHPGPRDQVGQGWKSTRQCLLTPTSCRWHPPLADSESPTACLPSPAAHPPIRPRQFSSYADFPCSLPHVCSRWRQP